MPRIRAAVCTAFDQPLAIEDLDLRAPLAGEVEVTLEAVAICHSDISYAEGAWGGDLPAVYGHEAAGRISATGPGVTALHRRPARRRDADQGLQRLHQLRHRATRRSARTSARARRR